MAPSRRIKSFSRSANETGTAEMYLIVELAIGAIFFVQQASRVLGDARRICQLGRRRARAPTRRRQRGTLCRRNKLLLRHVYRHVWPIRPGRLRRTFLKHRRVKRSQCATSKTDDCRQYCEYLRESRTRKTGERSQYGNNQRA